MFEFYAVEGILHDAWRESFREDNGIFILLGYFLQLWLLHFLI